VDDFEERKKRAQQRKKEGLDICSKCEHLIESTYTCILCGCAMRVKTGFKASTCPIDKWKAV